MTIDFHSADWPKLITRLCGDFPQLDPAEVLPMHMDRQRLIRLLANAHDLTQTEAAETLDDWLMRQDRIDWKQVA